MEQLNYIKILNREKEVKIITDALNNFKKNSP